VKSLKNFLKILGLKILVWFKASLITAKQEI